MQLSSSDIEHLIEQSKLPFPLDVEFRSRLAIEGPTPALRSSLCDAIKLEIQRDTAAAYAQEMADESERCDAEANAAGENVVSIFTDLPEDPA